MWAVARPCGTSFRDHSRAVVDLKRRGVRAFCPEKHTFFKDRKGNECENPRLSALLQGYFFVELVRPQDRDIVIGCMYTALRPFLGSYVGERFIPSHIPDAYITTLIEAGPLITGKSYVNQYEIGQKVKRAAGRVADIIGEVEAKNGNKVKFSFEFFGAKRSQWIDARELDAAS